MYRDPAKLIICPWDTDGDGDCGRPACVICHPEPVFHQEFLGRFVSSRPDDGRFYQVESPGEIHEAHHSSLVDAEAHALRLKKGPFRQRPVTVSSYLRGSGEGYRVENATDMQIPRLIHQTWKTADIPEKVYRPHWVNSWASHHPEWRYKLWTDGDLAELCQTHYPELWLVFRAAPGVVKADLGRMMILHRHGGLYADLDYMALKPLDSLFADGQSLYFSALPRLDRPYVHNALMAAAPGQSVWLRLLIESLTRFAVTPAAPPEILTGPNLFSDLIPGAAADGSLQVGWLDPALTCPLDWLDGSVRRRNIPAALLADPARFFPRAHAITFWTHNW